MADYTIMQLGPVILTGFEIPRSIPLGGNQRVIVNDYVGNKKRSVHLLGAQNRPLEWSGAFFYESALERAQFLESLMVKGDELQFSWGEYIFRVVIDTFHYDPVSEFHIPYDISLTIVKDQTDPQSAAKVKPDDVISGIKQAINYMKGLVKNLKDYVNKLNTFIKDLVQTPLNVIREIQSGIRDAVNSVIGIADNISQQITDVVNILDFQPTSFINGLITQVDTLVSQTSSVIDNVTNSNPLNKLSGTSFTVSKSDTFTASGADPLLDLIQVKSASQALSALLSRLRQPPFVAETTVINDNLFNIASKFYGGDLEAWQDIADFNGFTEAQLVGPTTVKLPPIKGATPKLAELAGTLYETSVYPVPPAESRKRGR